MNQSLNLVEVDGAEKALKCLNLNDICTIQKMKRFQNPISLLNMYKNGLKYEVVSRTGPQHAPIFKISLKIDNKIFFGYGSNLKKAKMNAAKNALFKLFKDCSITISKNINGLVDKTSVSILNEIRPGLIYKLIGRSGPPHAPIFEISVNLDEENIFFGRGHSLKIAKQNAADQVLKFFKNQYLTERTYREDPNNNFSNIIFSCGKILIFLFYSNSNYNTDL